MASPLDIDDLLHGFLLAERLIDRHGPTSFLTISTRSTRASLCASIWLRPHGGRLNDRVRHRATDSSCGLCGIENLEQALRPLPGCRAAGGRGCGAVRALAVAAGAQQLNQATGRGRMPRRCAMPGARIRWFARMSAGTTPSTS